MNFMFLLIQGRIIYPIFSLKTKKDGNKYNNLIECDYKLIESWKKSIHGVLHDREDVDFYSSKYYKEELEKIKSENENYLDYLEEVSAPLEYIDSIESENSLISRDMRDIKSQHTHCEIHSSLILSAVALNIPFPEHSQFPRMFFHVSKQNKQLVFIHPHIIQDLKHFHIYCIILKDPL